MLDKKTILKQYFGHSAFRDGQEQVVDAILQRKDALCVMPTGAGKSVCYQVPALMFSGITIVISPLISLMKDQVNALTQNGIPAAYLNSSLSFEQYCLVIDRMRRGTYKILYVAPERLAVPGFLDACRSVTVDLLAVDEAHCISQWGQDFRPSYLKIADFINELGYRPTIAAFTATATAEVKDDIEYSLKLNAPFRITTGFDRPNLKFEVLRSVNKFDDLERILKRHTDDSGIVYCSTRKAVEEVGAKLNKAGFSATIYHAGLEDEVRKLNQEAFVYDRKPIIVATNAFGMGIDKSNVSFVVHYNMPKDVESYYQEAGRAGRDGKNAECILLYSPLDVRTNQFLIEHSDPNPDITREEQQILKAREYDRLKQMTFYSTSNTCLRNFILDYFGEKSSNYCGNCSNCLTKFTEVDVTIEAQKILSCIKRTGERFGKTMICDILRGSKNEKIIRSGLNQQTTYGLMAEYKVTRVREIIDHLEFEEYIVSVGDQYPVLALTPKARDILFGGEKIVMRVAEPREVVPQKTGSGKVIDAADRTLFAKLKALRRGIADEKRVPAYVVFSDATLVDMCRKRPSTPTEMLEVSGVGNAKLARYGAQFLYLLNNYKGATDDDSLAQDSAPEEKPQSNEAPVGPAPLEERPYFSGNVSASALTKLINGLPQIPRRIRRREIANWLIHEGYLEWVARSETQTVKRPTQKGNEIGISSEFRIVRSGRVSHYIRFNANAQQFIKDHVAAIIAFSKTFGEECPPTKSRGAKNPFEISQARLSEFEFSETPLSISEITERINALVTDEHIERLKVRALTEWLLYIGVLQVISIDGHSLKLPSKIGPELGILIEDRQSDHGAYSITLYNIEAQRFIIDNLHAIVTVT